MKSIKENLNGILVCVFELVVGILVLVSPISFTSGIIMAFGVVLLIMGLLRVIKYFRTDPVEAARSQFLMKGLVALLAGGACAFRSEWFVATFPVLTLLYGMAILLSGLGKVQWTVDILRLKKKNWHLAAISAVLSIGCGIVIIASPFSSTAVLWMFTGISLIVEAVLDIVALCFGSKAQVTGEEADTAETPEESAPQL